MELSGKKLGLMISTAPEHPNLATALGLAQAALDRGANVYLYLIDDGVRALADRRLRALRQAVRLRLRLPEASHPPGRRRRRDVLRPRRADRYHQRHRPLHRTEL